MNCLKIGIKYRETVKYCEGILTRKNTPENLILLKIDD